MFAKYFGFNANPFSLAADFSLFKIDAPKQDICNAILRELDKGARYFLITGVSGVGKSQLLRYLFTQLPLGIQSFSLSGNSANYSEKLRFIIELTIENYQLGKKSLVVIDDAHEISEEDLRSLLALISQNKKAVPAFPIILCGLNNLEMRLESVGYKNLIEENICRYRLSGLNELHVQDYINFRLKQVGYVNEGENEIFSARAIKLIAASSQGIPHAINLVCGASLLIASIDDNRIVSEQIVQEAERSCLLSPKYSLMKSVPEQLISLSSTSLVLTDRNERQIQTSKPRQVLSFTLCKALVNSLSVLFRIPTKSYMRLHQATITNQNFLDKKRRLQKKFELEVLSGIGVCLLGLACLFVFNLSDKSNSIKNMAEMSSESRHTLHVGKKITPSSSFIEFNNPSNKPVKNSINKRITVEWESLKPDTTNKMDSALVNATHIKLVTIARQEVKYFNNASYFPFDDRNRIQFVNISAEKTQNSPKAWRTDKQFNRLGINERYATGRPKKPAAMRAFNQHAAHKQTPIASELEASVRERSTNRLKLDELGIDYSVESILKASRLGNVKALKLLLAGGIPPDIKDTTQNASPLLEGVKNGHLQVVQTLLEKGANADIRNNDGQTALITAARNGNKTIVKALLKAGAHANVKDLKGRTALSYAVQTNNTEIINLLARN
ncbi:MAG: hypothetical protein HOP23_00960 [Methylococcaceae bacterium]|nr:hypothetical protein [Methylococcaceae bacterium]